MEVRLIVMLVQMAAIVVLFIRVEAQSNSLTTNIQTKSSSRSPTSRTTTLPATSIPVDSTNNSRSNQTTIPIASSAPLVSSSVKTNTSGIESTTTLDPSNSSETTGVYSTTHAMRLSNSSSVLHNTTVSTTTIVLKSTSASIKSSPLPSLPSMSPSPGLMSASSTGVSQTTVVMPTVIPSWTNWTTEKNCEAKCCAAGGTVTQFRACTHGSITLTSAVPCYGNSSKVVYCKEGCPQCSSGSMTIVKRFVAEGCVVLGLVIKILYAG